MRAPTAHGDLQPREILHVTAITLVAIALGLAIVVTIGRLLEYAGVPLL